MWNAKAIFLTGGTGAVGEALVEALAGADLTCLVHQKGLKAPGVRIVHGDITRPQLGLSPRAYDELTRRIEYVVHCAAMTNFGRQARVHFDINTEGTKRVLELATRAGVPICHVSTAFAYSDQHVSTQYRTHAYERSKLAAEQLVRDSGLPSVIVRPSIVIGDSSDGAMSSFQGFHFLLDLFVRGTLPVPAAPNALVDFVPRDLVAGVIAALTRRPEITGEFWITAGEMALRLEQLVTVWIEHLRRLTGRTIKQPRFVDADIIERLFRPAFLPALPPETQLLIGRAMELVKYFNITTPFPSSVSNLSTLVGSPPLPNLELAVIRNVEYWVRYFSLADVAIRVPYQPRLQQA